MKLLPFFDQYEILYVHKEIEAPPPPVMKKDKDYGYYDPCTNSYKYKNKMYSDMSCDLRSDSFNEMYSYRNSYSGNKTFKTKYHMDIRCVPGLLNCLKIKQKQKLKPYVFSVSKDGDYWYYSKKDKENYSKILGQGTPSNYRKFNELLIKEKSIPTKKTE